MPDKVKALKIESSATGGTQNDPYPTEIDPSQDYLAAKGVAFLNLDNFLIDNIGRAIVAKFPDLYQNITYTSGVPTALEFFNSSSFITANRIARYDFTYTGDLLITEVLVIYDATGSAVLRTYTWTHNYSGVDYQSSGLVIT